VIERSRLAVRDLLAEAVASALARPGRAVLTCLGTGAGVGAFVATLGIAATAESQVSSRFDAIAATEVTLEEESLDRLLFPESAFPPDADATAASINGVVAAGRLWRIDDAALAARGRWLDDGAPSVPVLAADPQLFAVLDPSIGAGRVFDAFHAERAEPVAVIGALAAEQLGVRRVDGAPTIFLGDTPFTVVGIVDDVRRRPDVLASVLVPASTARRYAGPGGIGAATMVVATEPGAARQVAAQLPVALRPDAPDAFTVVAPPDPRTLRNQVNDDLTALFLALAAVSLVISAFGIANTSLVAVLERVPEIGLRRALGARKRHIAAQFIAESGALGLLGGLIGACAGLLATVGVAVAQTWTAVIDVPALLAAPLLGAGTGVLAGLYPAIKAASIEPAWSLRSA
jgi:putative ABC transport system permease protein